MPAPFRPSLLWFACLAAASLSGRADAAEAYDNCTGYIDSLPAYLSSPGYYCLREDLATGAASGAAITVASDDVTLDCNDFKVGGLQAGAGTQAVGIGTNGIFKDTVVRRCVIRGFAWGISMYNSHALIEDNVFDGNTVTAIAVQGKRARVRRNQITNTGGSTAYPDFNATGIIIASESEVSDNTIAGVSTTGTGSPVAIHAWDAYQPNMVLGSITGNRITDLHRASGTRFYAILTGPGRAVITDNQLTAGAAGVDAGGFLCNLGAIETGNSVVRNNTLSGFVAPLIATCMDGGGNVSL